MAAILSRPQCVKYCIISVELTGGLNTASGNVACYLSDSTKA